MGGDTSQTGDAEVERLIARGEYRSALEALVRAYQDLIVRHCTAMLGDAGQGEEVAQEVFLGAYAALPRFRQEASARTWLLAIARKQCLKALRDRRRRRRLEEEKRREIVSGAHRVLPDLSADEPEVLQQRVRRSGRCSCCATRRGSPSRKWRTSSGDRRPVCVGSWLGH